MTATTHIAPPRRCLLACIILLAVVAAMLAAPPPASASYGWPVKPFDRQHPIRGNFCDPRIGNGESGITRTFHFGVDVAAPDGTPVYATVTGTVVISARHRDVIEIVAGGGVRFDYWHVRPVVRSGQHVVAYRTVIGHIAAPWGHVHFAEWRDGRYVNPLRRGAMVPYRDERAPMLRSLGFERRGRHLVPEGLVGRVDLTVTVLDIPPIPVWEPWEANIVTPALVRWRVVGKRGTVIGWRTALDFRGTLPGADDYGRVYAERTRQNRPNRPGLYRIVLVRGLDVGDLPDGRYRLDVQATDIRGNRTQRTLAFTVGAVELEPDILVTRPAPGSRARA